MKINSTHLLIKMHYFFFMGSVGPTLPFLQVFGKQLGISPLILGGISAVVPILCLISKPIFGFIMDYSQTWRKVIYLALLVIANSCYIMLFLLPPLPGSMPAKYYFQNVSCVTLPYCDMEYHALAIKSCNGTKDLTCHWVCKDTNFSMQLSFHADRKKAIISPDTTCLLNINEMSLCQKNMTHNYNCNITCDNFVDDQCIFRSMIFWCFGLLMCLSDTGVYGFLGITDTICFAILGQDNQFKFGRQRLWGAMGFGVTAFLAGYVINIWSQEKIHKMYTPSIIIVLVFTCIDLICCIKLKMSFKAGSKTILKDVFVLLKLKSIIIFLCIATFTGFLNSIMRNFLFWYLEDFAIATDYMDKIKLLEGLIVAAQTLGEITFFFISGKILKKLGYNYTFMLCLICYALRLGLVSLALTPWWVLPIEVLMHGPSYALFLISLISYASEIAPCGTAATVQGLVQGVNEGFGVSVGSLLGGISYKKLGGTNTFRMFSAFAAFFALMYFILHTFYLKHEITDTRSNINWREPDDAQKHCVTAT